MKYCILLFFFLSVFCYSPRLVEIAKHVNSVQKSWIADETTPLRDYSNHFGVLLNKDILPTKIVQVREDLPKEFDSSKQWPQCSSITEVRDQSDCASCWAFGVVEVATDRLCIATDGKNKESLSVEDLLECCPTCGFKCRGGYTGMAWEYLRKVGISTGGQYGTTNWCKAYPFPQCDHASGSEYPPCKNVPPEAPACEKKCQEGYSIPYENDLHKFTQVYQLSPDVNEIKTEIYNHGPVDATFQVFEDFMTYKSGIYHHVEGKFLSLHTVKIIGWGIEDGVEYWRVVNSWNEQWGENGMFRIRLGTNECAIEGVVEAGLPLFVCFIYYVLNG